MVKDHTRYLLRVYARAWEDSHFGLHKKGIVLLVLAQIIAPLLHCGIRGRSVMMEEIYFSLIPLLAALAGGAIIFLVHLVQAPRLLQQEVEEQQAVSQRDSTERAPADADLLQWAKRLAGELTETLTGYGSWNDSHIRQRLGELLSLAGSLRHYAEVKQSLRDLANSLGIIMSVQAETHEEDQQARSKAEEKYSALIRAIESVELSPTSRAHPATRLYECREDLRNFGHLLMLFGHAVGRDILDFEIDPQETFQAVERMIKSHLGLSRFTEFQMRAGSSWPPKERAAETYMNSGKYLVDLANSISEGDIKP